MRCYLGREIGSKKYLLWIHSPLLHTHLNFFYVQPKFFILNLTSPHLMTLQSKAATGLLAQLEEKRGNALVGLQDYSQEL